MGKMVFGDKKTAVRHLQSRKRSPIAGEKGSMVLMYSDKGTYQSIASAFVQASHLRASFRVGQKDSDAIICSCLIASRLLKTSASVAWRCCGARVPGSFRWSVPPVFPGAPERLRPAAAKTGQVGPGNHQIETGTDRRHFAIRCKNGARTVHNGQFWPGRCWSRSQPHRPAIIHLIRSGRSCLPVAPACVSRAGSTRA